MRIKSEREHKVKRKREGQQGKQENEEKFCRDVAKRKKMRQEFDTMLGKVRYINVERENITQIVTYINSKSVFITIEPELTISIKAALISKIKKITINIE